MLNCFCKEQNLNEKEFEMIQKKKWKEEKAVKLIPTQNAAQL